MNKIFSIGVIVLISGDAAGAQNPSNAANARLCGDENPDVSIAGCTAIIQSRREAGRAVFDRHAHDPAP